MPYVALDLSSAYQTFISGWIAPIFFIIVAAVAIILLWKRQIRELVIFIVIAALCGLLIFFGNDLFGQDGNLTGAANKVAKEINTIMPPSYWNLR